MLTAYFKMIFNWLIVKKNCKEINVRTIVNKTKNTLLNKQFILALLIYLIFYVNSLFNSTFWYLHLKLWMYWTLLYLLHHLKSCFSSIIFIGFSKAYFGSFTYLLSGFFFFIFMCTSLILGFLWYLSSFSIPVESYLSFHLFLIW